MSNRCRNHNHPLDSPGQCFRCGNDSPHPKKSSLSIRFVATALVVALVAGFTYAYASASFLKDLVPAFLVNKNGEVRIKPPSIKIIGTKKPAFTIDELKRFRTLLEQQEFDALNATASMIQANFERDADYEYQAHDFFFGLKSALPEDEKLFDGWVKHSPDHFAPYLMRAHYSYERGWASRGTKFANETSAEQFAEMHVFFIKAGNDIDVALTLNPRLLTAHIMRLIMANAESKNAEKSRITEQTSALFPTSFLMHQAMLLANLPRWGGSYREMNDIAMQAYKKVETNDEFFMLFGMIFADQAWNFMKAKEYDKALELYAKALFYGEHYSFYLDRARTYCYMEDYDKALDDINRSISLRPSMIAPYSLRAFIYAATDRIEKANADFSLAEILSPGDHGIQDMKTAAANKFILRGHTESTVSPDRALASYDRALEIDPFSSEAFFRKGLLFAQSGRSDLAIPELQRAIQYDPRNIKAIKAIDLTLLMEKRFDEIIGYWNRFLALEPDNAEAYLERAGTFHHMGNKENSLADLKQACDLGEQKACSLLRKQGWK